MTHHSDQSGPKTAQSSKTKASEPVDPANKWQRHAEETAAAEAAAEAEAEKTSTGRTGTTSTAGSADTQRTKSTTESVLDPLTEEEQLGIEFPKRDTLEQDLTSAEMALHQMKLALEHAKDGEARARADVENMRKRMERQVSDAHRYALDKFSKQLLPVVDSLRRCIDSELPKDNATQGIYEGVKLTYQMLMSALEKQGIVPIQPAVGDPFDPEQHEAMAMAPGEGVAPNTVLSVLEPGYALNGRVLRAAMVTVAK